MRLSPSDRQATSLIAKYLEPGEGKLVHAYGTERNKGYYVGVTDRRIILIETGWAGWFFSEKSVAYYDLKLLSRVTATDGLMETVIRFATPDGEHAILLPNKARGMKHQRDYVRQIATRLSYGNLPCPHTVLLPHWDKAEDIGHEERADSFTCEACQRQLTAEEGRSLQRDEGERLRQQLGR